MTVVEKKNILIKGLLAEELDLSQVEDTDYLENLASDLDEMFDLELTEYEILDCITDFKFLYQQKYTADILEQFKKDWEKACQDEEDIEYCQDVVTSYYSWKYPTFTEKMYEELEKTFKRERESSTYIGKKVFIPSNIPGKYIKGVIEVEQESELGHRLGLRFEEGCEGNYVKIDHTDTSFPKEWRGLYPFHLYIIEEYIQD